MDALCAEVPVARGDRITWHAIAMSRRWLV